MKNTGILSMQNVANYGSYLQAYALKSLLEGLGHRCTFLTPEKDLDLAELHRPLSFYAKRIAERFLAFDMPQRIHYYRKFHRCFDRFRSELSDGAPAPAQLDAAVIGSDEVFNCIQSAPWCFSSQLFGNLPAARKVVSYAGSFGHTTYEDLVRCGVEPLLRKHLGRMDSISVRDRNSFELIEKLTGRPPLLHLDPVLIHRYDDVLPQSVPDSDYILVYSYPNRIREPHEIAAIRQFARSEGKKLISIGFYFPWCDKTVIPHPFGVLAYFRDAAYVVTDTFHGTVMSIKYNKPFSTLIRPTNRQKLTSLLEQFGLASRAVDLSSEDLAGILRIPIDYSPVNGLLERERERTADYLARI